MVWVDPNRPHAVYRIWDEHDRLVYVGCSVNPDQRLAQHRAHYASTWGREDVRMAVEWHPDRPSALAVETTAIKVERPLYNALHHPDRPKGWHMRPDRPPREEWGLVWCGPDDPPWVALRKAIENGTLRF